MWAWCVGCVCVIIICLLLLKPLKYHNCSTVPTMITQYLETYFFPRPYTGHLRVQAIPESAESAHGHSHWPSSVRPVQPSRGGPD